MSFLPLTVKKFNQFSATGWIPTRYSLASQLAYEVSVGSRHERSKVAIFHKIVLRRNAAKVPVTSEQKLCTKSIKKKLLLTYNTKCQKQILTFIWNIFKKVLVKWNKVKFTGFCTISLNFEIHFLEFSWEFVFRVISGNYFYRWF